MAGATTSKIVEAVDAAGREDAEVCMINTQGCDFDAGEDCFCQCTAEACNQWVYYEQEAERWQRHWSAGKRDVLPGMVVGWMWGDTQTVPVPAPVVRTFDQVCSLFTPTPTVTQTPTEPVPTDPPPTERPGVVISREEPPRLALYLPYIHRASPATNNVPAPLPPATIAPTALPVATDEPTLLPTALPAPVPVEVPTVTLVPPTVPPPSATVPPPSATVPPPSATVPPPPTVTPSVIIEATSEPLIVFERSPVPTFARTPRPISPTLTPPRITAAPSERAQQNNTSTPTTRPAAGMASTGEAGSAPPDETRQAMMRSFWFWLGVGVLLAVLLGAMIFYPGQQRTDSRSSAMPWLDAGEEE